MFAYDIEATLVATAVLVNTLPEHSHSGRDELASPDELDAFVEGHRFSGSRSHDDAELQAMRALRAPLRALWTAGDDAATVETVNRMLVEGRALPQLVRHDEWDWHVHATPMDAPLAERMAVEAAMAVLDVVRAGELSRLAVCAADDCGALLVDLSRNRSKRFCDVGNCGNRSNVAAYRARRGAVAG